MELYRSTIESNRSKPGQLLAEGTAEDIANWVNSVGDEWEIGQCREKYIGLRFENPPDGWTPEWNCYIRTPIDDRGGFPTLADAVRQFGRINENVILKENDNGY